MTPTEPAGTDAAAGPDLRILSSHTTPQEVAAVTAVLTRALEDLAATAGAEGGPTVSAWQRSQRPMRTPITTGAGAWRGFSG